MKKLFCTGVFDLFHDGHKEFLRRACEIARFHGAEKVVVGVGSDWLVRSLKRQPAESEHERAQNVRLYFDDIHREIPAAVVIIGEDDWRELRFSEGDLLYLNEDAFAIAEKVAWCERRNIEIIIGKRDGVPGNPSTSKILDAVPYRLELAGGWLDDPEVSAMFPAHILLPVVVARIKPAKRYAERAGLATSTRRTYARLFGSSIATSLSMGMEMAKRLALLDSGGSQDAFGLCCPGVSVLYYEPGRSLPVAVLPWQRPALNLSMTLTAPRPDEYCAIKPTYGEACAILHHAQQFLLYAGNTRLTGAGMGYEVSTAPEPGAETVEVF